MAQIARNNEAEKAVSETAGNVAELGKRTADKAVGATREAAEKTQDAARRGFEYAQRTVGATAELERAVARRSAEGAAEVGQAFVRLVEEQGRHNVEAFKALTGAADWAGVARIQAEFVRVSLERGAEFARRYVEVAQAVFASAASATKEQARKAA
jgi:hypothetical protein